MRGQVHIGTPFTRLMHQREVDLRPQCRLSPIPAQPSHGSYPKGSSTYGLSGQARMRARADFVHLSHGLRLTSTSQSQWGSSSPMRRTPRTDRAHRVHLLSQWDSSRGVPSPCRHTPHPDRAPPGAPPTAPVGEFACGPALISGYMELRLRPQWANSHAGLGLFRHTRQRSVPHRDHREPHLRPQWADSHVGLLQIRHTPRTDRAPWGAQHTAPVDGFARGFLLISAHAHKQIEPHGDFHYRP